MDEDYFDYGSFYDTYVQPDYGDISYDVDTSGPSYVDFLLDENYGNEGGHYTDPASTAFGAPGTGGSPINITSGGGGGGNIFSRILSGVGNLGGRALDFLQTPQGIMGLLGALAAAADREEAKGGGTTESYQGPREYTRRVAQTRNGPIVRYAANGGLMALKNGGPVVMEEGAFVMPERAVKGAGGPSGIQRLIPGARMIRGPGTGTSDDIPAVILGRGGSTPAALSNGEAYVPKQTVQDMGGAPQMYSLMHKLQKRG